MSKPGKVLKGLCKRLGVRLTVKRGKKRVYKSVKVLKAQCANKKKVKKKKKKVKRRRRRFGMKSVMEKNNVPDRAEYLISQFLGQKMNHHTLQRELTNEYLKRLLKPGRIWESRNGSRVMIEEVTSTHVNYRFLNGMMNSATIILRNFIQNFSPLPILS